MYQPPTHCPKCGKKLTAAEKRRYLLRFNRCESCFAKLAQEVK